MSIQKKLRVLCLKTLGCKAEPWDNVWDDVKELVEAFGERRVVEAFEEWAEVKKGELIARPIGDFSRVAAGICTGTVQLKPKGNLFQLLNDLAAIGGNQVLFNREQQAAIGRLMVDHSPADIKAAFSEFWGNISGDDFLVRQAAKTFTEAAEQLLVVRAKRVEDARKQAALIAACTENEVAKAAEEARKALEAEVAEQDLIEDTIS